MSHVIFFRVCRLFRLFQNPKIEKVSYAYKWEIFNNYNQSNIKHKPNTKNTPKHSPLEENSTQTPTTTTKENSNIAPTSKQT
jgi:hypothetical protein